MRHPDDSMKRRMLFEIVVAFERSRERQFDSNRVVREHARMQLAAAGDEKRRRIPRHGALEREHGGAAQSVSAQFRLGAVAVEIFHRDVVASGNAGFGKKDQAVRADAAPPIAQFGDAFLRKAQMRRRVVDDDEIIARAVHFREFEEFHNRALRIRIKNAL